MPTAGLSRGPGLHTPRGQLLLVYLHAGVAGKAPPGEARQLAEDLERVCCCARSGSSRWERMTRNL